jgi:flagellar protein FlgJ
MRIDALASRAAAMAKAAPKLAELKRAADEFEAVFVKDMVRTMRQSVGKVHFGQSLGGDMFDDVMDGALAKSISEKGGIGLSQSLYDSMAPEVIGAANRPSNP